MRSRFSVDDQILGHSQRLCLLGFLQEDHRFRESKLLTPDIRFFVALFSAAGEANCPAVGCRHNENAMKN